VCKAQQGLEFFGKDWWLICFDHSGLQKVKNRLVWRFCEG
jgi:hypothetical protein